ncbi:MAG: hypothetical protein HYS69_11355 [candidate division NC10 bacterium]|nr:hypothetical protein [candidate division NC10 bacterium]
MAYPDGAMGLAPTIVALVLLGALAAPAAAQPAPVLPVPREIGGSPVFVALAPDAIRAIDDPTFVRGEAAARQMAEDEAVLGVRIAGGDLHPTTHLSAAVSWTSRLTPTSRTGTKRPLGSWR